MKSKYLHSVSLRSTILKISLCISFLMTSVILTFSQPGKTPIITQRFTEKKGNVNETYFSKQKPVSPDDSTRKAEKRIIVEFTGESLAALYKKDFNKSELKAQIQLLRIQQNKQFDTFHKDLNTLYIAGYHYKNKRYPYLLKPELGSKYTKTYFGQQVTIDSLMIEEIKRLPYVKAVHPDRRVKATLDESVPQINADSVWNELDCEGDSVIVGILDTGIDYNHSDLGGGFGPGYKVIGGYDYVNLDEDPMDDNFHGTHVAGIVAANGTVRGVAPNALLHALKVLDQEGMGWYEDILSAIEYTVDPNNDDDFADRLDVANMSLGGYAMEDDPMVDAVETAIGLGVTYCIAAGNDGHSYAGNIGSPGTSPSAITVGAVNKNDTIAAFSSAGPTEFTYILKPDILAPGVNINSTIPGGEYELFDGTSMATPHITGVCALLKRLHPDWGPEELKAAIMLTGHDIGIEKIVQGSGVVNAYRAAITNTLVNKPTLHFGLDTLGADQVWIQIDSLVIKNISGITQEYSLGTTVSEPGVTLILSQDNFTLDPGAEINIIVTVEVDNAMLETPEMNQSIMHNGDITLQNNDQSFHITWAFIRSIILNLTMQGDVWNIFIFNTDDFYWDYDMDSHGNIFIKPGEYYVIVEFYKLLPTYNLVVPIDTFYNYFTRNTVIKKINIKTNFQLVIDEAEATNKIIFSTEDENGNHYSNRLSKSRSYCIAFGDSVLYDTRKFTESELEISFHLSSGRINRGLDKICISTVNNNVVTNESDFLFMDTLYLSELPEGARAILGETRRNTLNGYHFCFNNAGPFVEPTGDITLSGDASSYKTIHVEEPCQNCNHMWWPKLFYKTSRITDGSFTSYDPYEINMPYFAVSMPPGESHPEDFYYYSTIKRGSEFYTPPLQYINNRFIFGQGDTPGAVGIEPGDTITYSTGPWTPLIQSQNNSEPYGWYGDKSIDMYFGSMTGGYNEFEIGFEVTGNCTLYNDQGTIIDTFSYPHIYSDQEPGRYHANARIRKDSPIYGLSVNNTVDTWFDLQLEDADPPTLVALHVLDPEGNQTHVIKKNDPATLLFTASDEEYCDNFKPGALPVVFDSVEVYAKKHSETEWIPLDVDSVGYDSRDGLTCQSTITDTDYDTTHIDVKISCVDDAGNRTETIISPAFFVKNIQVPIAVDDSYTITTGDFFTPEQPITVNDIDPFGESEDLKAELVSSVTYGNLTYFWPLTGTFLYRAPFDFTGVDAFTYRVKNEQYTSDIATVTLNIIPDAVPEIIKQETNNQVWIYPNPANELLNISFNLEIADEINITVYDITGTKLVNIYKGLLDEGKHNITWDLTDSEQKRLYPGMYIISFQREKFSEMYKVVIE